MRSSTLQDPEVDPSEKDEFIPTRESLLSRLKDPAEDAGWREFFEIYWKLIYNTARRWKLGDAEAQDVVQETMISVHRKLPGFVYDPSRCAFKTWLQIVTFSRIKDQLRKRSRAQESLDEIDNLISVEAFAAKWDADYESNLLQVALDRLKTRLSPQTIQIFTLCELQLKGAAETARILNQTRAHVYVVSHRVRSALRKEVAELRKSSVPQ